MPENTIEIVLRLRDLMSSPLMRATQQVQGLAGAVRQMGGVIQQASPSLAEISQGMQEVSHSPIMQTTQQVQGLAGAVQQMGGVLQQAGPSLSEMSSGLQAVSRLPIVQTTQRVQGFTSAVRQMGGVLQQAGPRLVEMGEKMRAVSNQLRGIGLAATAAGSALIGPIGIGIVKLRGFQEQLNIVGAVSGATAEELEQIRAVALELGRTTAFSAQQAAAGMVELAKAGFTAQQTIQAIAPVLALAAGGGLDLAEASSIVVRAIQGMGLSVQDASRVSDVLSKAAAATTADVKDLGEALKYVAPIARTAGLTLEETVAAIGALSDAGIAGTMAGTNLAAALRELSTPTEKQRGIMRSLGLEVFDAEGKMKPLVEIIRQLEERMAGMTEKERLATLQILLMDEGARAMSAILGQGSQRLRELQDALASAGGEAQRMERERLRGLVGTMVRLRAMLDALFLAFAEPFAGIVSTAIGAITALINLFLKIPAPIRNSIVVVMGLVGGLLALGGGIAMLLGPIAQVVIAFGMLTQMAAGATAAMTAATLAVHALKFALISTGVLGLLVAVGSAIAFFTQARRTAEPKVISPASPLGVRTAQTTPTLVVQNNIDIRNPTVRNEEDIRRLAEIVADKVSSASLRVR